jgi:hypothetical protein
MNIKSAIPILAGILAAAVLPLGVILLFIILCALCARESRRLRTLCQLTDWSWEHDMIAIRRSILNSRRGMEISYYRPRRFYGPR